MPVADHVDAVLLAGGQGRRVGGQDKGLLPWQGQPLATYALAALAQQQPVTPAHVWLVANRNMDAYQSLARADLPMTLITDTTPGFAGPLAGLVAAMQKTSADWLLWLPCDMPQLPCDLLACLRGGLGGGSDAAVIEVDGHWQPVCGLAHRRTWALAAERLAAGQGSIKGWLTAVGAVAVPHLDMATFINCNTLGDFPVVE